jgi:predicted phosphodiesterase
MICFISDIHGDKNIDAFNDYVKNAKEDDLLIILGDIELHFRDTDENREFSKYFEE